ncbi:MAG: 50S ribosomal protein L15 [Lentisphaeria bacterium]|nr:50S ribosomal protein L15 [Lentisphaeria bacterium]
MKLHSLSNTFQRKPRKRVGRGDSSGNGRTAGRGDKGAGQRSGTSYRPYFEGGQIPLFRRLPKRGFKNPNHRVYTVVNVEYLEATFEAGADVDKAALKRAGYLSKTDQPLKILGDGELTKALKVRADKFSESARRKIEAAGGECLVG